MTVNDIVTVSLKFYERWAKSKNTVGLRTSYRLAGPHSGLAWVIWVGLVCVGNAWMLVWIN